MIIRIGIDPPYKSFRARLARWLRLLANRADGATVLILATDDVRLRTLCVRGCAELFVQKQAADYMRENAEDLAKAEMAAALEEWEPDERRVQ